MNYLDLAKRLRQECGISGTGPAAVTNQIGEARRLVDWIADAWTEIQNRHMNWRWMRSSFTVNTTNGNDTYAFGDCTDTKTASPITRFAHWWWDDIDYRFRIYRQTSGVGTETWLNPLAYEDFKFIYKIGMQSLSNSFPSHYTVDEDNKILLGPKPDDIYVVSGDYQRGAQLLTADSDIPDMPSRFHMLIVYDAMLKYGGFESAPEVIARAAAEGGKLRRQLEADQLPPMRLASALA